jgi:uroporphyrinogen-III synthase
MSDLRAGKTYALFAKGANKKLIGELEAKGAKVVLFPEVETEDISINPQIGKAVKNLSEFDWVIFPDIYAVDYFLQALEKLEIDFFELDLLRVCVFGETVADRLRYSQLHADIISNSTIAEDIFGALRDYEIDFENTIFLIPKAEASEIGIFKLLSESNAKFIELPIYRIRNSQPELLPKLKALLKGGAIDEFIFTSPTDVINLASLFPNERLADLLSEIAVSATDDPASQALREFGIETRAQI